MSDSESESDHGLDDFSQQMDIAKVKVVALPPSEMVFDQWSSIPIEIKEEAGQRMKICAFWCPILLQREEASPTALWALQIGLTNPKDNEDICLKSLYKIEILEAILRALDRGSLKRDQSKHILWISNMFNLSCQDVLGDALYWLERTGEPNIRHRVLELGHPYICFLALRFVFTEYSKYIQEMGTHMEKTMRELKALPPDFHIEKSEEMKKKGNENFQKKQYEDAVKFYSKAIKYFPDNHIIYGNRALCYIRCKKYLKAVGDGKRATLIKPLWAKGHYRYCEALFFLGEVKLAINANISALRLCKDDPEGVRDLEQQQIKFNTEMAGISVGSQMPKSKDERPDSTNGTDAESRQQTGKSCKICPQSEGSGVKTDKQPVKNGCTTQMKGSTKDSKPSKSEITSKNGKGEPSTTVKKKKKPKNRNCQSEDQKVIDTKATVCKELKSLVQDAHTALADLRSRNAEQSFSQALAMLQTNTAKELGLSSLDELLLHYGRVSALTEIGQPEELAEAQKLVEKMKSYEERTFHCLVHYAVGRVYLKENRFAFALEQFSDSLQMVKNQITPGKLTWPLTKDIVQETQPDYFKETLESAIELCRFPPIPDAICRLEKCHGPLKAEIYFTDPDFKGFIQIFCCQRCIVEYHIACWKTLKTSAYFDKNEKDFLQEACLTPDCVGKICCIKIFGPTGLAKCKFEAAIPKPHTPKKPKVNQKCTSLKKLKSKEEHRLKRKQHKHSFQDKQAINEEILQQKEDSTAQRQQETWLLYRDRVLFQISHNMDLLREEKGLAVSALISCLKPWLELDVSRGNRLAERMLNWQQEPLETLGQVVELLLERKNRVWARVLIQLLSTCRDVNLKLYNWACHLNNAGLNAAKSFIERYAEHLEQLDMTVLLNFGPLHELIIAKLGSRPEPFGSIGLTVTDYLKQAPPHDRRLFIWTLEEHRDEYVSSHIILDDYFDMMDGHCSVLKKSDENQNNSPMKSKSRGRKKKRKEPMAVFVFPETRRVTPGDEQDQDYFEDASLSFLHPADTFSVPRHLQGEVAVFEEQYNSTRHRSHHETILDYHPDKTKDSLFDYFSQILEEHGPLVAEDPLLVGEVVNFPPLARVKIQEAGGLESFLLSLGFIKIGSCIGLVKHGVYLQQVEHGAKLDDLDDIVYYDTNTPSPDLNELGFTSYLDNVSPAQTEASFILPSPFGVQSAGGNNASVGRNIRINPALDWCISEEQPPHFLSNDNLKSDLRVSESDAVVEMDPSSGGVASLTTEESRFKKHAAVQTCPENTSSVAVNTELLERFESCQGDINKKEKSNRTLEQQIEQMANSGDRVNLKHKEDISSLEEDIQTMTANIQVTNKELAMFQEKLEEELKKDQKEKKANQEAQKSLKLEIEQLREEYGSLGRSIREKRANYEAKLKDFLEFGNQSANEKMSLEDEIKRCKDLFTSATRRSRTAWVSEGESSRDQGLYGLYRELADAKALLTKLDEAIHRCPNQDLEMTRSNLRANVQEVEKKITTAETQYQEQIDQMKNGTRVRELLPGSVDNQPKPPALPPSAQTLRSTPPLIQQSAAPSAGAEALAAPAQTQHKPPVGTLEPLHVTIFDKAMERLATIFPDYTRLELMKFVQELRSSNGGSLSRMDLQDVVSGVTQLILDHQEKLKSVRSSTAGQAQCAAPPVWQSIVSQRGTLPNALNMEDPCIICHDDMCPDDICVLECRHSFHKECIRSWLKDHPTCPTCRDHALLPEDFPLLTGRRRQAL